MKSLLFCLLLPFFAFQQRTYTIGEVMRKARQLHNDSTTVQITGFFTKKLSGNTWVFEDRTAEIQVDIAPEYLPQKPFSEREAITIKALVQYEINKPITLKVSQPVMNE